MMIILSFNLFAAPKEYLFCLGQEEKEIFLKRLDSSRRFVNEQIISLSLQLSEGVILNKRYLKRVCESKKPSFTILKLLLKNKKVFLNNINKENKNLYALANANIQDIKRKVIYLFMEYLSRIKGLNKDVNCFHRFFPKLKKLLDNAVYTIEETAPKELLKSFGNIDKVFFKIGQYPTGLEKC